MSEETTAKTETKTETKTEKKPLLSENKIEILVAIFLGITALARALSTCD